MAAAQALGRREVFIWCLAALVTVAVGVARHGGAALGEDGYQYISAAENFLAGHGFSTSLLHFDVDRAPGTMPAPLTMWPPGFPAAIAIARAAGLTPEGAAVLISALAFIALVPLLVVGASRLAATPFSIRITLAGLLLNGWSCVYPVAATSESLFTLLAMAALVLCIQASSTKREGRALASLATASALLGLSYWVRYAGLLAFAGVAVYYAGLVVIRRTRASAVCFLAAILPAALLIGANMARNIALTGSWKAGYETRVAHGIAELGRQTAVSLHHLLLGDALPARVGFPELMLLIASLALVMLGARALRSRRRDTRFTAAGATSLLPAVLLAVYAAGLLVIARNSVITFDARMFYPMLPVGLLGGAILLGRIDRHFRDPGPRRVAFLLTALVALAAYGFINARNFAVPRPPAPHRRVAEKFAGSLRAWVDVEVPPAAVILASDGQATGYALQRPTVSLVHTEFSTVTWTETSVRDVAQRFGARFLILYPGSDPGQNPVQTESVFLSSVLHGGALPSWLEPAAENTQVRIFRIR